MPLSRISCSRVIDNADSPHRIEPLEPRLCFGAHPLSADPLGAGPLGVDPSGAEPLGTDPLRVRPAGTHPLGGVPRNVNISRMPGNQAEGSIAIDPTNPDRVFAASNLESDDGLFTAVSTDGGATWSAKVIADRSDGLAVACCDPSARFDEFGNLFLAYLNANTDTIHVVVSGDRGVTFSRLARFRGDVDQPTVAAGAGQVWVTYRDQEQILAVGARVEGLGRVRRFFPRQRLRGSADGNFGDVAIGPRGQVLVTYQTPALTPGPSEIRVNLDPDGVGGRRFGAAVRVASTRVGGFFPLPAQPHGLIDAEADLAYDLGDGPAAGRVYLAYVGRGKGSADTNVLLRFSDDDGVTWSKPRRVNDDATNRSQFLPRVEVDATTGRVALTWHDARDDDGVRAIGTANARANDDARFWGVYGTPTAKGVKFVPNFRISAGTSSAAAAGNRIDHGDYSGLAFHAGKLRPAWADNSNSTGDNPDGSPRTFDLYTALIEIP